MRAGDLVDHFSILTPLGAGGMGEVYRATDTRLEREVAIKVLPAALAGDPERLRRFAQEARVVGQLSHPNILALYDIGTHDGGPYLVTELLDGETLRDRLKAGALPVRKAIELAVGIANGLAAAHAKGIIHRDLKPGNVLVTTDGVVKILDFGLAKLTHPSTETPTAAAAATAQGDTASGFVLGTVGYMAPEQIRGLPVDQRADIFALGCVLYEMLAGHQAFKGETPADVMSAILSKDPPPLTGPGTDVPAALRGIVGRCLEKRPEDRFSSAHDLALALEAVSGAGELTSARPTRWRGTVWSRGRRVMAAGAGVAAVAILAVAALMWPRRLANDHMTALNFQLLSTFPGSHRWPTFSPDGSMIAFVSDADGSPQLWVKNLAGGDPIRITSGNLNPSHPSWSPRNDQIIFGGGESLETHGIWSVPPLGGTPRRIGEFGFAPSFSADGSRIAFQRNIMGIFLCGTDGSGAQKVTGMPSDLICAFDDGPVFSLDGKQVAVYPALPGFGDLWSTPVAGGKAHQLTFDDCGGGHPVWTPDGQAIVFSSARGGSRNLWRIAATGGAPQPVTTGAGDDDEPAISRDGTKLLYTNVRYGYALMSLDVATGQSRQILEQRTPITFPSFSPAGDVLAFSSGGFGKGHVFLVASDGTGMQQIVSAPGEAEVMPEWSSDGESVYFIRDGPKPGFSKVARAGGASAEIAAWLHGESVGLFHFAPDGRRVAYCGSKDGGPEAAVVRDVASGAGSTLAQVLQHPRWSHDGRFLVGNTVAENSIFICPPTGESCTAAGSARGVYPFWSQDDSRVYFVTPGKSQTPWELRIVNRDGTGEKQIAEMPGISFPTGFLPDISRKGTVPWVQLRPGRRELWLAELTQ
jgi:serine/threonine protein kinase